MEAVPFFFNLVKAKVLDQDLFTIWLSADPEQEPAGILTFGYSDPLRYEGNITYHPVIMKAYWYFACILLRTELLFVLRLGHFFFVLLSYWLILATLLVLYLASAIHSCMLCNHI